MALDVPFNGTLGVCSLSLLSDAFLTRRNLIFSTASANSKTLNCICEYTFDDALTVARTVFGGNPGWNSDVATSSLIVGFFLFCFQVTVGEN